MNLGVFDRLRDHGAACLLGLYLTADLLLPIASFGELVDQPGAFMQILGNALPYGPWLNRATLLGPILLLLAITHSVWRQRAIKRGQEPFVHSTRRARAGKRGQEPFVHSTRRASSSQKVPDPFLPRPFFSLIAKWSWADTAMMAWVLTPFITSFGNGSPWPQPALDSLYLMLTWGSVYVAGRIAIQRPSDLSDCLWVVVGLGGITLLLALTEFIAGRFWYETLYGFHPFYSQGETRFFGYRPLLMFEDPNQIAMWWTTVALAALTLLAGKRAGKRGQEPFVRSTQAGKRGQEPFVRSTHRASSSQKVPDPFFPPSTRRASSSQKAPDPFFPLITKLGLIALVVPPFLFQAIGGGLLTLLGATVLWVRGRRVIWVAAVVGLLVVVVLFVFRDPLLRAGQQFSETTAAGRVLKGTLRNSSIGSFGWRLGLEADNAALLRQRTWFGWGDVNFWQVDATSVRPWGLATLVTGAYGVLGFAVWLAVTLLPCGRVLLGDAWRHAGREKGVRNLLCAAPVGRVPRRREKGVRNLLCAAHVGRVPRNRFLTPFSLRGLAVIVLVHGIDASLNSAYWLPTLFFIGMINGELSSDRRVG